MFASACITRGNRPRRGFKERTRQHFFFPIFSFFVCLHLFAEFGIDSMRCDDLPLERTINFPILSPFYLPSNKKRKILKRNLKCKHVVYYNSFLSYPPAFSLWRLQAKHCSPEEKKSRPQFPIRYRTPSPPPHTSLSTNAIFQNNYSLHCPSSNSSSNTRIWATQFLKSHFFFFFFLSEWKH